MHIFVYNNIDISINIIKVVENMMKNLNIIFKKYKLIRYKT